MKTDMTVDMKQLINSMEQSIKLRNRARAEKRAEEKLMRAAAGKLELDGMSAKVKGAQDAVQRDQLIGLMGGF